MKKTLLQLLFTVICFNAFSQETIIKYLSGTDKDHTIPWDFYCTSGRNSGKFKGYHAEVNWVVIENKESPFTVYAADKNTYLQMLHPAREKDALENNNVEPAFPEGNIGFLNAISPIGTKFQPAEVMGPQSQKNQADGKQITGTLWFDFIH